MKSLHFLFLLLVCTFSLAAQYTQRSILADGDLYKFRLPQSGVYALSHEDLSSIPDIDLSAIDPDRIQVYSNHGGLLPLENMSSRSDDLKELAIMITGAEDGRFDIGDRVIFYAEGADVSRITGDGSYTYEKNIYDSGNYAFVRFDAALGKRIEVTSSIEPNAYLDYTYAYYHHENDLENLLGQYGSTQGTGKRWFGETFTNDNEQIFDRYFDSGKAVIGTEADFKVSFAARSGTVSKMEAIIEGQTFRGDISSSNIGEVEAVYAKVVLLDNKVTITNASPKVEIKYSPSTNTSEAWLDYIELSFNEYIDVTSGQTLLFDPNALETGNSGFEFQHDGSDLRIWDITDLHNIQQVDTNNSGTIRFGYQSTDRHRYYQAFDLNQALNQAEFLSKVTAQNIHGITTPELVIVFHKNFREAAQKLLDHRTTYDGMMVEMIDIDQIYNEFGGGKQDPISIRDMARMFHKRSANFNYMLLMGDATYDYRGIYSNLDYQNYVPTYQTDQSLSPIYGYPSDDFFALLSDSEGADDMEGGLDIGVGRIPCTTSDQAMAVVNKIVGYDTNIDRFGDWRTRIGFAADDVDASWDTAHMRDSDEIAREVQENSPCLLQQKVYMDSYVQEATPGGARYPDANKAINDNIFQGQLVFNYLGHGGPKGLSQERVLQIRDIRNWNNSKKLPVFITATCSFTGFDEPSFLSAGEQVILNPNGGAVALFTTVRSVFARQNKILTRDLFRSLFNREDGLPQRLGDVLINSQNRDTTDENTRKFLLIGDPSMRIGLPRHDINITEFNGKPVTDSSVDTLGALSKGKFKGEIVLHRDGSRITDFNGKVAISIYDKPSELRTLVNDNQGPSMAFDVKKNILYRGSASVTNGQFEIEYILPKDIEFEFGPGSILLYATDEQTTDAAGCYEKIIVGGTTANVIADNEGPLIDIYFNDRSFVYGGKTNAEPILIVDLEDENGINLSSTSIGHDITAALEDKNGEKTVLNAFYEPALNQLGSGTVTYQMPKLEVGPHKIYLKAWDILNNSSEEISEFIVFENEEGFLENVLNYPNPFSSSTNFTFEHDLINNDLDIQIDIYTISGKLIKTIQANRFSTGSRIDDIHWDAQDDLGSKIAKGIYLYKIKVQATELNLSRESDFMRLVILN